MIYHDYTPNKTPDKIGREHFSVLNKTEKVSNLFQSGKEILSREENGFSISLYVLEDFFVEVWYKSLTKMIVRIEVTSKNEVLNNYDQEIDLTGMF